MLTADAATGVLANDTDPDDDDEFDLHRDRPTTNERARRSGRRRELQLHPVPAGANGTRYPDIDLTRFSLRSSRPRDTDELRRRTSSTGTLRPSASDDTVGMTGTITLAFDGPSHRRRSS